MTSPSVDSLMEVPNDIVIIDQATNADLRDARRQQITGFNVARVRTDSFGSRNGVDILRDQIRHYILSSRRSVRISFSLGIHIQLTRGTDGALTRPRRDWATTFLEGGPLFKRKTCHCAGVVGPVTEAKIDILQGAPTVVDDLIFEIYRSGALKTSCSLILFGLDSVQIDM